MTGIVARRRRGGVTLIEIAVVIAIIGLLAAVANSLMSGVFPAWRTRRTAKDFATALNECHQLAIAQGVEYRIRMIRYDTDIDGTGPSGGEYAIERGNAASGSTTWDVLPVDTDGVDDQTDEGDVSIDKGQKDEQPGVSIEDWGGIAGVEGNDIVFSPRGWLENPASDFDSSGWLVITFVNKYARSEGTIDNWEVSISRAGMVRMLSNRQPSVGAASGTAMTSSSDGSGSGFTGM